MRRSGLALLSIVAMSFLPGGLAHAAALGTVPAWSYEGTAQYQILGYTLAVEDVNGDGFADLVVGAPFGLGAGEILVFLGSAGGPSSTPDQILTSTEPNFAATLASAGDWNGDGFEDVVVGSSYNSVGSVSIFLGSAAGLAATPSWTVSGTGAFGQSVAGAGDVNGDGYGDILAADFFATVGSLTEAGRAYLYLGGPAAPTSPAWTLDGDTDGGLLGDEMNGAGDINADGYDDIIINQKGYTEYKLQGNRMVPIHSGRVFAFLGSASGPGSSPVWTAVGPVNGVFGWAVGSAGDVNGDGFADIMVSDNQADVKVKGGGKNQTGHARGMVYVYYGSPAGPAVTASWTVTGDQDNAFLGNDITSGDFNHDGFSDVAISAPKRTSPGFQQGRIYAYLGSPSGLATTEAWFVDGGQEGAGGAGFPMAAGPVNGDLFDDLLVGAPAYDTAAGTDAGRADLYLGQAD